MIETRVRLIRRSTWSLPLCQAGFGAPGFRNIEQQYEMLTLVRKVHPPRYRSVSHDLMEKVTHIEPSYETWDPLWADVEICTCAKMARSCSLSGNSMGNVIIPRTFDAVLINLSVSGKIFAVDDSPGYYVSLSVFYLCPNGDSLLDVRHTGSLSRCDGRMKFFPSPQLCATCTLQ